jgi:hypothetical protein
MYFAMAGTAFQLAVVGAIGEGWPHHLWIAGAPFDWIVCLFWGHEPSPDRGSVEVGPIVDKAPSLEEIRGIRELVALNPASIPPSRRVELHLRAVVHASLVFGMDEDPAPELRELAATHPA